jgi:hypothetical protein
MAGLNQIERDCQDVLIMIRDMMAPGHPVGHATHTELSGRVRDVLRKLTNKEYGCVLGIHSGHCQCKG